MVHYFCLSLNYFFYMRLAKSWILNIFQMSHNQIINYPLSLNLNYSFSFGFLLVVCLIMQIISGILLSMHYISEVSLSFASIKHIMRDVRYGWLIRYILSNVASAFFICIYLHIGRGLYYKSYNNTWVWLSGILLFIILMLISFLGYILPWGQMSYWGAVVITNLLTAIPFFGEYILLWLWGGFSVANPTLKRFFILHYFCPFLLVGLSCLHIYVLHLEGSKNTINLESWHCQTTFNPYFVVKDLLACAILLLFLTLFVFSIPECYFLPFYTILRVISYKGLGALLLLSSILVLVILPFIPNSDMEAKHDFHYSFFFFNLIVVFVKLMWFGG